MGKIREFFYLLVIAVLISLSIIFIGAAFREEYPLWKNQKILEDLRSDVKAEETGDEDPGIDWVKLKKINPDIVGWIKVPGTRIDYPVLRGADGMNISIEIIKGNPVMPVPSSFSQKHRLRTSI